jgi:hypothetical protein
MIKTLTLHNSDTTPMHNGVRSTHEPHSIVPWCCVIVMHCKCKDHSPKRQTDYFMH